MGANMCSNVLVGDVALATVLVSTTRLPKAGFTAIVTVTPWLIEMSKLGYVHLMKKVD